MKLDRLETHDRLLHLKKDQSLNVAQGAEDCLKKNPLSIALQDRSDYIYIFAHPRTADDGVTKRMVWQPRLTKPQAQTNSYLFRAKSKSDVIEVCWLIPPPETWGQFKKGNIVDDDVVVWSINMFKTNKEELEKIPSDDLSDDRAKMIYRDIALSMDQDARMRKIYARPEILEA